MLMMVIMMMIALGNDMTRKNRPLINSLPLHLRAPERGKEEQS